MITPLRKTVIPVAGFGTRMLPIAKAVPKEMLPVLDRPVVQYVVEEAMLAGLREVVLVSSRDKPAIKQHFSRLPRLEQRLRDAGKEKLLESLNALIGHMQFSTVYQEQQLGLGHAVLQARDVVGNEPCLCMLGDTIFSGDPRPASQLAAAYAEFGTSIIGLEQVPAEKVSRYGIVGGSFVREGVIHIDQLVEKPNPDQAPSQYAIAARYVLTPAIFACLDSATPGKGGEIQLTDALQQLLRREPVHGVVLSAKRHDIGNLTDWLATNLIFAADDPALRAKLAPVIQLLAKA